MNLAQLQDRLGDAVKDSSLQKRFKDFINEGILALTDQFDIPSLRLLEPWPFSITSDKWIFRMPENFQKRLFRCVAGDYKEVRVTHQGKPLVFADLDQVNIKHDIVMSHVQMAAVALDGITPYLGVYPKAAETLGLWYYRKPLYLDKAGDVCDCIPESFHSDVILPRAIIKSYEYLQDQVETFDPKALQYWEGQLLAGLNGSGTKTGFLKWLQKNYNPPRRHGGRNPIGPGRGFYGG